MGVTFAEIEFRKILGIDTTIVLAQSQAWIFTNEYSFKKYKMNTVFSTANDIYGFYTNFKNGALTPTTLSEPLPDYSQFVNKIPPVVGINFEDLVVNSTEDVVIFFYNAFTSYFETYDGLNELTSTSLCFTSQINLKFYKFDLGKNDFNFASVNLELKLNDSLPQIFLFSTRYGKANPIRFSNDIVLNNLKTKENLRDFLLNNTYFLLGTCTFPS